MVESAHVPSQAGATFTPVAFTRIQACPEARQAVLGVAVTDTAGLTASTKATVKS